MDVQRVADCMDVGVQSVGDRPRGEKRSVLGPKPVKIARRLDYLALVARLGTLQSADRQSKAAVDGVEIESQAAQKRPGALTYET